jgi:hypothetical protein
MPDDNNDIEAMMRAAGITPEEDSSLSEEHRAGFVAVVGKPNVPMWVNPL